MNEPLRVFQNRSEMNVLFVHSEIDDRNLSMAEFRVYCHLSRRSGNGVAFPGIDSIASVCRMAKNTVIDAIKSLESGRMILAERKPGMTTRYILTAPSEWTPLPRMNSPSAVANGVTERRNIENATVANGVTKGNPLKEIQEGDPVRARKKVGRFNPPTLAESKAKAVEMGMPEREGEKFFAYYESNGWRVGKNPMKSWPMAMVTWRGKFEERNGPCRRPATEREDDHETRYGFPRGTIPLSKRPPPFEDDAGADIGQAEYEKRYPLNLYDHDK